MKIIKSNSELRDLRDKLKKAIENEDLKSMKDLYDKIDALQVTYKRFVNGTKSWEIQDKKTGLNWHTNGSKYTLSSIVGDIERAGSEEYRLPTLDELKFLFDGNNVDTLESLGLTLALNGSGFYWVKESITRGLDLDDKTFCFSFKTKNGAYVDSGSKQNYLIIHTYENT